MRTLIFSSFMLDDPVTNTDSVDWLPVFLVITFLDVTLCRLHISQNILLSALEYVSHVRPIFQLSWNFLTLVVFSYSLFFSFIVSSVFVFLGGGTPSRNRHMP